MSFQGLILSIFPRPRRPVRWRAALPLVIFLVLFIGGCVALDTTDLLLFSSPAWFALLVLTPWLWWMHVAGYSGLSGWRSVAALVVRLLVLGLFVVLLVEPRGVRKHDALSVVFVLDRSQSISPGASSAAVQYITRLVSEKPAKDGAGLVTFGRSALVELPASVSFPFEGLALQVEPDATNVEKALSLAAAVLPEQQEGRLVLISDGAETEGNVPPLLDELKSRGIQVDVLPIAYDYQNEVLIERLELPRQVKVGENYEAAAIVSSITAGKGTLFLQENNQIIFQQEVEFQPGKNRFVIPIYLREPGYYEYTASIELPEGKDGWRQNNKAISYLNVQGDRKVLIVTDVGGDQRDWQPMAAALRESQRSVDVRTSDEFPSDALSLLPYDSIVFVNVPQDRFVLTQLEALRDAVYDQGAGFLMVGGEHSFGPGGYHRTPVEEILPVSMDVTQRKILPKGALAIILHTCEFPQGNTWAKNITKQAIKVLGAQDEVGVLIYDWQGAEKWLFQMTPASQYQSMATLLNNAQIGDMPDFGRTMSMGLSGLQATNAATKHMIIISDGDAQPPTPQLIAMFQQAQVSVSTVAVFPHGGQVTTMQAIAAATGGRFYFPQSANLLPSIFIKEAKTLKRSMIQNKTFTPEVGFPSPVLKGITSVPKLHGYVLTTPKPRSVTVLKVPEAEEPEPILTVWRHGLGQTAAFTSDLSPNWGADWMQWDKYKAFVQQLITEISRQTEKGNLRVNSYAAGGQGVVVVDDYAPQAGFLNLTAQVNGPRDTKLTLPLAQVGPRRYEAKFPLTGEGRYQIIAVGAGANDRQERAFGGFMVPYSQEYLRLRSNPILLEQIAAKTGGRILNGRETGEQVFVRKSKATYSSLPIFDWFLILLACLIPLDVAVRRVQVDMQTIRGWLGMAPTHKPSEEMFSQLLRRKKTVGEGLRQYSEDLAEARRRQVDVAVHDQAPAAARKPRHATPAAAESEDDASTTARLLAKRRKLQEDDDDQPQ